MKEVIKKAEIKSIDFIESNNRFIETGASFIEYIDPVEGLCTFGKPNTTVNIKKEKTSDSLMYPNSVVFAASYSFDNEGKRETHPTVGEKDSHAIFFGDAHCFGEGLNNNQTLPFYYGNINTNYEPHNYGFLGHGPNHMLYRIQTQEFTDKFKDKEGRVFFIYRDDAIKISVGEVPWGKGHPKYEIENGALKYKGSFGGQDYTPTSMYLPSMFLESDYNLTLEIFKEIRKTLVSISNKLELYVVIIPLSFTNYEMQPLLEKNNINVINLYTTDLERITNANARFLDGVHTGKSNQAIVELINKHLSGILTNEDNPFKQYHTWKELKQRLDLEAQNIPSMIDFPYDDAGVIIANVLKRYSGKELEYEYLINYLKDRHSEKLNKLKYE